MERDPTLTLSSVMSADKDVANVRMLGLGLGLPDSVGKMVQRGHPMDVQRQQLEVATKWLERDSSASWSKLAAALEGMGLDVPAMKIRKQHLNDGVPQDTVSSGVSQSPSASSGVQHHTNGSNELPPGAAGVSFDSNSPNRVTDDSVGILQGQGGVSADIGGVSADIGGTSLDPVAAGGSEDPSEVSLCPSDLQRLYDLLHRTKHDWRKIGERLGFSFEQLSDISFTHALHNDEDYFQELLRLWLERTPDCTTMKILADALSSAGYERIANQLKETF